MPSILSPRADITVMAGTRTGELARLEALADLLDSRFRIPGTQIRFGIDPVLGLVPGIGDLLSAGISLYIAAKLADLGVSRWVQARMLWNIALDTVIGIVPVLGDAFDVGFKANKKNTVLARRALQKAGRM